jgi:ParB family chromosome partitioning protein
MKRTPISLTPLDDLFQTDASRADAARERVLEIPLCDLHSFENHPFKVLDDEAMRDTADSIAKYGVLVPGIVRPRQGGGYEIVAGHRRKRGCALAGRETMPAIVRELNDDEATIIMVDTNLQRESLLFSERAFAYKMKLDAIKRLAGRPSKNKAQAGQENRGKLSVEVLAEQTGESREQIKRYIRLTALIPSLLDLVDNKKLAFNTAVELSWLTGAEQETLLDTMAKYEATPLQSQAARLKKHSQEGTLTPDILDKVLSEEKKNADALTIKSGVIKQYFPASYTPRQMQDTIIHLLEGWAKKQAAS